MCALLIQVDHQCKLEIIHMTSDPSEVGVVRGAALVNF